MGVNKGASLEKQKSHLIREKVSLVDATKSAGRNTNRGNRRDHNPQTAQGIRQPPHKGRSDDGSKRARKIRGAQ